MQSIVDTVQRLITKGLTLILRDLIKVGIYFVFIIGIIYTLSGAEIVTKSCDHFTTRSSVSSIRLINRKT